MAVSELHFVVGKHIWKFLMDFKSYRGMRVTLFALAFILVLGWVKYNFPVSNLTSSFKITNQTSKAIIEQVLDLKYSLSSVLSPRLQNTTIQPAQKLSSEDVLKNRLSKTVIYVWCGRRNFEFRHYLSVLSSIKFLQPFDILFYYKDYPVLDSWMYNTWFKELVDAYPYLQLFPVAPLHEACLKNDEPNKSFIYHVLTKSGGGIYLDSDVIITSSLDQLQTFNIVLSQKDSTAQGKINFMLTKFGYPGNALVTQNISAVPELNEFNNIKLLQCSSLTVEKDVDISASQCAIIEYVIFPKYLWKLDTSFGRLARTLFYGHPEFPLCSPNVTNEPVPKIGHMVWLGGGNMDFTFYLGVLSLLHVAQMETVYIHGDQPPTGFYWNLVTSREPGVVHVHRVRPRTIYGQSITSYQHVSDMWRADILFKFGGVYMDTDAVFVKPLDDEIFNYDAVASYDWPAWNRPFPDVINMGVTMGKRGAKYWKLFLESFRWFLDEDFGWNGIRRPYQVFERHPNLLKIDPHLQVICYLHKCHPTWWPDYHNDEVHHRLPARTFDWQNETYAIHWTHPVPDEYSSHKELLKADSMFASIGKFILRKAGMFEYFQNITIR